MKRLTLAAIRFYQRAVSPGLPAACRYQPTCSRYAYEAVERYGVLRGGRLTVGRILRCVPWRAGGYDPVPLAQGVHSTGEELTMANTAHQASGESMSGRHVDDGATEHARMAG